MKPGALCKISTMFPWITVYDVEGDLLRRAKAGSYILCIKQSDSPGFFVCLVAGRLGQISKTYLDEVL